jgi:hypothetical protein
MGPTKRRRDGLRSVAYGNLGAAIVQRTHHEALRGDRAGPHRYDSPDRGRVVERYRSQVIDQIVAEGVRHPEHARRGVAHQRSAVPFEQQPAFPRQSPGFEAYCGE